MIANAWVVWLILLLPLGAFLTAAQERVGAVGDEASDLLGFDFGL